VSAKQSATRGIDPGQQAGLAKEIWSTGTPVGSPRRLAASPGRPAGLLVERKYTSAELAELFSVTRSTVYRTLQRARQNAAAADAA
jgi:hypothetical protein